MKHETVPTGAPLSGLDLSTLPNHPAERLKALLGHLDGLRDELIAELDRLEGDPDFEPTNGSQDPPWITDQRLWATGTRDDREEESDFEPSLGAPDLLGVHGRPGQQYWAFGRHGEDLEEECEDEGAQCDDEGAIEEDQDTGNDEPDDAQGCNWQDEGDQTRLRQLPTFSFTPADVRSPHQNVGPFMPVRVL